LLHNNTKPEEIGKTEKRAENPNARAPYFKGTAEELGSLRIVPFFECDTAFLHQLVGEVQRLLVVVVICGGRDPGGIGIFYGGIGTLRPIRLNCGLICPLRMFWMVRNRSVFRHWRSCSCCEDRQREKRGKGAFLGFDENEMKNPLPAGAMGGK